jgi:hypothetical protein
MNRPGCSRVASKSGDLRMRSIIALSGIALIAALFSAPAAYAQSAGPDEAIAPNGEVLAPLVALTAAQRHAIYATVIRQKARPRAELIPASVGAAVPPSVELLDLPDQPNAGDDGSVPALKYTLVQTDVVVIDPIAMRVVDVICRGARP